MRGGFYVHRRESDHTVEHIFNRVYVSHDEGLYHDSHAIVAASIRYFYCLNSPLPDNLPADIQTSHYTFDAVFPLTLEIVFELTAALHQAAKAQEASLIYCPIRSKDNPAPFILLTYLIEYVGMTLANAYRWLRRQYGLMHIDREMLWALVQHFQLPYTEAELNDQYFFAMLFHEISEGIGHVVNALYIGGIQALQSQDTIWERQIRSVVRLDQLPRELIQWDGRFTVHDVPITDAEQITDTGILRRTTSFIHENRLRNGGVLVHCHAGISRSATLVLAYLIEYQGMTLPTAYAALVAGRAIANPHPQLMMSLVQAYGLPYTTTEIFRHDFLATLLAEAYYDRSVR